MPPAATDDLFFLLMLTFYFANRIFIAGII
jgi:hypothetical protein